MQFHWVKEGVTVSIYSMMVLHDEVANFLPFFIVFPIGLFEAIHSFFKRELVVSVLVAILNDLPNFMRNANEWIRSVAVRWWGWNHASWIRYAGVIIPVH